MSDWITITQEQVNLFAEATGDHQWIHVDVERAKAGPFGGPIAHGFLTLSLLPRFYETAFDVVESRMGVNYGLNRVRFMSPVPVGSRAARAHEAADARSRSTNDGPADDLGNHASSSKAPPSRPASAESVARGRLSAESTLRWPRLSAAAEAVLAPGLEHRHRHARSTGSGCAGPRASAGAGAAAAAKLSRSSGARPRVSEPNTSQSPGWKRTSCTGRRAARGEGEHAIGGRLLGVEQGLPVGVALHLGVLVVVEPGAAQQACRPSRSPAARPGAACSRCWPPGGSRCRCWAGFRAGPGRCGTCADCRLRRIVGSARRIGAGQHDGGDVRGAGRLAAPRRP